MKKNRGFMNISEYQKSLHSRTQRTTELSEIMTRLEDELQSADAKIALYDREVGERVGKIARNRKALEVALAHQSPPRGVR